MVKVRGRNAGRGREISGNKSRGSMQSEGKLEEGK